MDNIQDLIGATTKVLQENRQVLMDYFAALLIRHGYGPDTVTQFYTPNGRTGYMFKETQQEIMFVEFERVTDGEQVYWDTKLWYDEGIFNKHKPEVVWLKPLPKAESSHGI